MCATGIKQGHVLYHNSFFWYLHEHRHVHSLKIRQCATHSVDNSTEREREREGGVGILKIAVGKRSIFAFTYCRT